MKNDQELRQLADQRVRGELTLSSEVPSDLWPSVFLPLGLMDQVQSDALLANNPHVLYGELQHAMGGRFLNGFPIFGQFGWLTLEELERLQLLVQELTPKPAETAAP